jgi:hypothetical protein
MLKQREKATQAAAPGSRSETKVTELDQSLPKLSHTPPKLVIQTLPKLPETLPEQPKVSNNFGPEVSYPVLNEGFCKLSPVPPIEVQKEAWLIVRAIIEQSSYEKKMIMIRTLALDANFRVVEIQKSEGGGIGILPSRAQ